MISILEVIDNSDRGFIFLLYNAFAYKLYRDDVGRILRETGKISRDMMEVDQIVTIKGVIKLQLIPEDVIGIVNKRNLTPDTLDTFVINYNEAFYYSIYGNNGIIQQYFIRYMVKLRSWGVFFAYISKPYLGIVYSLEGHMVQREIV